MNTKPKARKFRIRRNTAADQPTPTQAAPQPAQGAVAQNANANVPPAEALTAPTPHEDGFGDLAMPGSAAAEMAQDSGSDQEPSSDVEQELAAIRAEGLTGRQLRMARRAAQKHGLSPTSDFDAVRLLRARGVDPFARNNMMELAAIQPVQQPAGGNVANLPATTTPAQPPAPAGAPRPLTSDERAAEIMGVQRDIARRRRKKLILLATRLAIFVLLPTLIVGFYYYRIATPLYATNTEFVIQKADSGAGSSAGGLGGLLGGSSFATVQESIIVQSYLQSREAMLRLDTDLGFREHYSGPEIDPLVRLAGDATDEQVYDTYRRQLSIGYDPTEGVVKMEIRAADPFTSQAFSEALIGYAEERVDQMSIRLREDQMVGAREGFVEAENRVREAQSRVLELQERRGVLSAEAEVSAVFSQITTFELELQQERLRLSEIQSARSPNETRVRVAEENIARLENVITELRTELVDAESGETSLARIQSELVIAQAELETRQAMLAASLQQMEDARIEANRQTLYISMGVFPVAPDEAAYPRAFESTLLAFLVFAGVYLMVSMTAAILKEQVSS